MGKIVKDACILFAITLVAGILLGGVYEITKEPIAAQNEKAKQAAYKNVLAEAESFESLAEDKYSGNAVAGAQDFSADEITEVVAGVKNGKIIGFVITVVASDGYGGDIKYSVGVAADGTYKGTSILSINETAGLGMRAKTDPSFLAQYNDVKVEQFSVVKDGTGASSDDKIDAIGGSTITSNAITKGINAALSVFKNLVSDHVKTVGGASIE